MKQNLNLIFIYEIRLTCGIKLLLSVPLWGGIVEWAKIIESYGVSAPIRWLRDDEFWLLAVNSNLSVK